MVPIEGKPSHGNTTGLFPCDDGGKFGARDEEYYGGCARVIARGQAAAYDAVAQQLLLPEQLLRAVLQPLAAHHRVPLALQLQNVLPLPVGGAAPPLAQVTPAGSLSPLDKKN